MVAVVSPLFHKYVYGAVPPEGVTVAEPLQTPQEASTVVLDSVIGPGSFTIAKESEVVPLVKARFQSKINPLSIARQPIFSPRFPIMTPGLH